MQTKSHSVPSLLTEIETVRSILSSFGFANDLPKDKIIELELVLVELFTNIVKYGYAGEKGFIDFAFSREKETVVIEIKDQGKEFLPALSDVLMPRVHNGIQTIPENGYGLPLVVKVLDSINFEREGTSNITTLVKAIK